MIYFFIVIGVIILDQLSKYYAELLLYGKPYKLIDGIFHLTYARNDGAAFSIFSGNQIFLKIVTALAMAYLVYYLIKVIKKENGNILYKIGLSFILGGGIGNFIDRVRFDYVIDFFDFTLINFAIFNIADSFVVVGTIILAYLLLFNKVEI